jgi:Zn-dependent oligopeptidase
VSLRSHLLLYLNASQLALAQAEAAFAAVSEPLSFYQNVSPDKALRDASNEADVQVSAYGVESSMRKDVYDAKVAAKANMDASGEYARLDGEQRRLVDKMLMDGRRAGLALPEEERAELAALRKDLSAACLEFSVGDHPFPHRDAALTPTPRKTLTKKT